MLETPENEDIRYWLMNAERLLNGQHQHAIEYVTKVAELLPQVYPTKNDMIAHWQQYHILQEVIGNCLLNDFAYAMKLFQTVKTETLKCLKKS